MSPIQSAIDRTIRGRLDPAANAMCRDKVCHVTMESAQTEAKRMRKKYGRLFRSYECRFCGAFHVGRAR